MPAFFMLTVPSAYKTMIMERRRLACESSWFALTINLLE
jgi:hypothetical protein